MDLETMLYICMEALIAVMSVVGNTLVCYVIMKSSTLRKKVMYMFVTSLAFADICVGLIAIPFAILTKLGLPHSSPHICIAMLSFIMVPTQISIFNMMAIALERYMAIRHARVHYTKLTLSRSHFVIALTWLLSTVIGMLPLLGWNRNDALQIWNPNSDETRIRNVTSIGSTDVELMADEPVDQCEFMKVMDFDYMIFNFMVCVLPPLIISAVLYSIIFFSFLRATNTKLSPPEVKSPLSPREKGSATPVSSPPRNGGFRTTSLNHFELTQLSTFENGRPKAQLNGNCHGQQSNRTDSKHATSKPICPTDIRVEIESPTSSAQTVQAYQFLRDGSNTSSFILGRSTAEGTKVDTQLLRVRLEKLEKQQSNEPSDSIIRDRTKNGNGMASGYSSVNSSISSPAMRSRSGTDCSETTKRNHREQRHRKRKREFKAAAVLCLIVLCFAICWMPIHTLNTIHRFNTKAEAYIPPVFYSVAILLSHANSTVNFFLYSWRLRAFRQQLKRLVLKRIFPCYRVRF